MELSFPSQVFIIVFIEIKILSTFMFDRLVKYWYFFTMPYQDAKPLQVVHMFFFLFVCLFSLRITWVGFGQP